MSASRAREESRDARLDEPRAVLDSGAVALMTAIERAPQLEDVRQGREVVAEEALPRLRESLHDVWRHEARIKARVGAEHEVARAYKEAHEAVGALHTHWMEWADRPDRTLSESHLWDDIDTAAARSYDASAAVIGPERG